MEEKTKIKNTVDISKEQGIPIIPVASSNKVIDSPTVDIDAEETLKAPYGETNNTLRSVRVRACFKNIKQDILSTYSKRNPVVNALLSIFFVGSIILSLFMLLSSIGSVLCHFDIGWVWCYGAAMMFYPLFCIYFMCRFIVGNHKNAVIPALMGNAVVHLIVILLLSYASASELPNDEECDFLLNLIFLLVIAIFLLALLFAISFSFIYLIMKIKKYGASAWALLEVSRGGRTVFEKINIVVFSVIWLLPIAASAYDDYKETHPTEKYPSHKSAKIGDYYDSDGTISSNLLTNKCAVGVVFSLETSVDV